MNGRIITKRQSKISELELRREQAPLPGQENLHLPVSAIEREQVRGTHHGKAADAWFVVADCRRVR